ncbi:MAG TPA: 2Fe-2S iron-sulfur cluster-binding protein [Polyangiaceae bacterium]|nr:2Fe-2S iron-sulfur cluster-binding protein [Polyangiaceae bacterium]
MPTLLIIPSGKTAEVAPGTRLLTAILDAGEKLTHQCDGKAECGTCHIFVTEGKKSLSKAQRTENERLDATIGVGSKSRLACQAHMGEQNVTVELLGFASG